MKYWFDTEFIEDGKTIDLLSIGIVSEEGNTMYAENQDAAFDTASPWVKENVLTRLNTVGVPKATIRQMLLDFVGNDPKPEFWAYYGAYDWVALCQLFGTMMELPKGWPFYCRDIKQWCDSLGNPRLPKQETQEHHALNDALWTKQAYEFLENYKGEQIS